MTFNGKLEDSWEPAYASMKNCGLAGVVGSRTATRLSLRRPTGHFITVVPLVKYVIGTGRQVKLGFHE